MYYVDKKVYEAKDLQEKTQALKSDISVLLQFVGGRLEDAFPLVPYLLYKVSSQENPKNVTFKAIADGDLEINDNARFLALEILNEELWQRLLPLTNKYSSVEFALAVVNDEKDEKWSGVVATPKSILRLSNALLAVKAGESVADICCGEGSYLVASALEEPNAHYSGYELNVIGVAGASMKAELLEADIKLSLGDVFSLAEATEIPKFDKIFAHYPWGIRLKNMKGSSQYLDKIRDRYRKLAPATSSDWIFNSLICDLLAENGKAIGIMTNGSTWNSLDTSLREYFVEHKLIECVITLPARMFPNTGIATTLVVFSHNNEGVRMIDATNLCQQGRRQNEFSDEDIRQIVQALSEDSEYSKVVSVEALRDNEYILNLSRYIMGDIHFKNGVAFESVISNISRGAQITASQLDEMVSDEVTNMQYLMIGNIQDGLIDAELPYLKEIEPRYERYCLKHNALIISKNGYPFKVAVASVEPGQQILANGNLYIVELDEEKVNPYYLQAFFNSDKGNAALKSITVGATILNIGVDKLKKLEIPLPALEEQKRIAEEYQVTLMEVEVTKLRLERAINKLHHIWNEEGE